MKKYTLNVNSENGNAALKKVKVVVITTVMLSFISYWRASAIVLSDLASSAYYALGIAEKAVGPSAPWFVLFVMIFAYGIRAVYIESSSMFVRGGVYRVVHEALGETAAKFSVSALLFDYLLTGPISSVAAGQYISGLVNSVLQMLGYPYAIPPNTSSMLIAVVIELYFWRKNIIGIEESSGKALRIFQITALLAAVLLVWSLITVIARGATLPPFSVVVSDDALGLLKGVDWVKSIGAIGVLVGLGHSILAVSGEETLAQVYREIEAPKLKNLLKTGMIIFLFALVFTGVNSLLAGMIVPTEELLGQYNDNALSGLAMHLLGSRPVLLALQAFVVFVGFLILAGAVNTALIGANSVLNRVAEDGVLHQWFRKPHEKFGTSYRIIHTLVILQLLIIVLTKGDVFMLGEAYAFGVVWSFVMKAYSMIVLRYKQGQNREWRVPINVKIGNTEIPIGLGSIFTVLLLLGIVNLFTKPYATVGGIGFTIALYVAFGVSERANKRIAATRGAGLERFNVHGADQLTIEAIGSKHTHRKLVAASAPNRLYQLLKCLQENDPETTDIVVMHAKILADKENATVDDSISTDQDLLFSEVIKMAEKEGKPVLPIVVPTNNALYAVAQTAAQLGVDEIFLGVSKRYPADYLIEQFAIYWGMVQTDGNQHVVLRTVDAKREVREEL
ncbi:MAG TPA: APC family permease [Bacteroidota bacterium]|nr:APC family permease [Bacteroidota bacterium]